MSNLPFVIGYLAGGTRFVCLESLEARVWLKYHRFGIANRKLADDIAEAGLPLFQQEDLESIVTKVANLDHFIEIPAAHHIGWNGGFFAQHDGTISGAGDEQVRVLFDEQESLIHRSGTLGRWKKQVAVPVGEHPLAAFAMIAMFLPPLLRLMPGVNNPVFEIIGPRGSGKSAMLKLAGSVAGPLTYARPLRDVQSRFDQVVEDARDYPVVLDEVSRCLLTTSTKPKQAELFGRVAYDLPRAPGGRVVLMAALEPLRTQCGLGLGQDDVVTLMLQAGAHLFDSMPEGISKEKFSDGLLARAADLHGVAFPAFLAALTADLNADDNIVKAALAKYQAQFEAKIASTVAGDGCHQAARAFGAVFAAGKLAVKMKILPWSIRPQRATLAAWRLYTQGRSAYAPFSERLEELLSSGQLAEVDENAVSDSQAEAVTAALGSITVKKGMRVIRIWSKKIEEAFPDWSTIQATNEVRSLLQRDGNNNKCWGNMAPGTMRSRDYQFKLPALKPESLFD